MSEKHGYAGKDLEAMSFAVNYHRWILSIFAPYLGSRVVEVGAGTGSFSELLLERRLESLSLVEPSTAMYQQLCRRLGESQNVKTYNDIFENVAERIRSAERPDSIIYVNVLEHIADDEHELNVINKTLDVGGRIFIFVPALRWLHGSYDRAINHFRRYTRTELEKKCVASGFKVIESRYFDLLGVLPWWVKYKVLQSNNMEPGAVRFYDQRVVPIARTLESSVTPPIGKNVLLIGEKL
ncbi:MAG TPA: methyltransferase domain-containing protein [Pyrinomonadaceae bacterium]|nr:methyltransferase domain-containing protein [Pyrinomonadaceae bacterium]